MAKGVAIFFLALFFFSPFVFALWPKPSSINLEGSNIYGVSSLFTINNNNNNNNNNYKSIQKGIDIYMKTLLPFRPWKVLTTTSNSSDSQIFVNDIITSLDVRVTGEEGGRRRRRRREEGEGGEDESYSLEIIANKSVLECPEVVGCFRGLETFSQLVRFSTEDGVYFIDLYGHEEDVVVVGGEEKEKDREGWWRGVCPFSLSDQPRFSWRGLMIDTSHHYIPVSSFEKIIDGMMYNKMNVLHWHAVDAPAFPLNSSVYPELAGLIDFFFFFFF